MTTTTKTLTIQDVARILAFIPYRKGRIFNAFENFTVDRAFDRELAAMAQKAQQNFQPDNHAIWIVMTQTGDVLGLWFTDHSVIVGKTIALGDW